MSDVSAQALATTTYDPLTGIAWDTRLSGTEIGVYFYPGGQTVTSPSEPYPALNTYTTTPFNAYQTSRFQDALQLFSNITKLTFAVSAVPDFAAIRFFQASFPLPQDESNVLLGFASPPGTSGVSGQEGYNAGAPGWSSAPGGTLESGGNAFTTLIHEMGHGFGLAHPHDLGGNSTIFPGVVDKFKDAGTAGLNQGIYTMMSYRDGWADGPASLPPVTIAYGEEQTPMALDVAVLQQKYGANTTFRTGADNYMLPDQNVVGTGYTCIWDAGGANAIQYAGPANAIIDLRPATLNYEPGGGGYVSYVDGIRGGYTIAAGTTIQAAVGGTGNDVLTASAAGSLLKGGAGNNVLVGGAGNDTVISAGKRLHPPRQGRQPRLPLHGLGHRGLRRAGHHRHGRRHRPRRRGRRRLRRHLRRKPAPSPSSTRTSPAPSSAAPAAPPSTAAPAAACCRAVPPAAT